MSGFMLIAGVVAGNAYGSGHPIVGSVVLFGSIALLAIWKY